MRGFGKYLREVSVVILGVAVTLIATNWISNRGEKKDLELYLDAVELELEDNLKQLEIAKNFMNQAHRLGEYFKSTKLENLNADSIKPYYNVLNEAYLFVYKAGAFDMLKTSGAMRLIKDKELVLDIWQSYSNLERYKAEHDMYMTEKSSMMTSLYYQYEDLGDIEEFIDIFLDPKNSQLRVFYKSRGGGAIWSCINQVKKTLAKF